MPTQSSLASRAARAGAHGVGRVASWIGKPIAVHSTRLVTGIAEAGLAYVVGGLMSVAKSTMWVGPVTDPFSDAAKAAGNSLRSHRW